jgi:hypothetical protein
LGDALGITTGDLAAPNDELGSALKQGFCCAWLVKETIFDSLRHGTRRCKAKRSGKLLPERLYFYLRRQWPEATPQQPL